MNYGYIHSIQSLGAVDGPGLRSVIFFQGCPLRCVYCHNPDTWDFGGGEKMTADEVADKIKRFMPYIKNGGITLSGGECLAQPEFAEELLQKFKDMGLHTAIDTSGVCDLRKAEKVLKHTDLVICDIKFTDDLIHKDKTGVSFDKVKEFLALTERLNKPLWIRHVVVPGLTDSEDSVNSVINEAKKYSNLEKIELLPFRKLCLPKYENMGIEFPLNNTLECSKERIEELRELIDEKFR